MRLSVDVALAETRLANLVNLVTWRVNMRRAGSQPLYDEALDALCAGGDVEWFDPDMTEFHEQVMDVLVERLSTSQEMEEVRMMAIGALMIKAVAEDDGDATRILVHSSNRLTATQLNAVKHILTKRHAVVMMAGVGLRANVSFDYELDVLLPMLGARHPSLGIDVHDVVTAWVAKWFDDPNVDSVFGAIESLTGMRSYLPPRTSDAVCEMLRDRVESENGWGFIATDDYLREEVAKVLHNLSRPVLTWIRIQFRVRIVGRLSLMRAESAERLYAPGGVGADAAIKRLKLASSD